MENRLSTREYVERALGSLMECDDREGLAVMGLVREASEMLELVERDRFFGQPLDRKKALYELGDVLWYLALAAQVYGFTLEEIMEANLVKLARRYPSGAFSHERWAQERTSDTHI